MIQVDDLGIAFGGRALFSNAKFVLQEGEKCGLVGRNGSGKSTFFRLLTGEEMADKGAISIQRHYSLGTLRQHIAFQKEHLLEEAALGLPLENLYKAETILFGLGFKEEDLSKPISSFSGGYQLRLHLAKVLIQEPRCLLLDEPTNYLDITSIRWFTKFLQSWKGEFILISHDREFMDGVTTHTLGIHREKLRKVKGSTVAFYEQIMQEEEVHEKTRLNLEKKRSHMQSFIDRFGAKATKAAQAGARKKMISRIPVLEKLMALYHLDFAFHFAPLPGKKMIDIKEVSFSFSPKPLIQKFSLSIEKGERIAIIGKNGRGKSTLLRLLAKELEPQKGLIKYSENLSIGYFGQTHIDRLTHLHTVEEELTAANPLLNQTEIKSIAGLMMFSQDQSKKLISILSGGERSRVLLGKIIAKPCNLLLLDEPTHHLDMESIEALIDALEIFEGTVVIATHSELILKRLNLDKIVICHEERQDLFLGDYADFLEKDGWHEREQKLIMKSLPIKSSAKKPPKSLQTLEREISQKEAEIRKLENDQERLTHELMSSPNKQEISRKLAAKGETICKLKGDIEQLYRQIQ